MLLTDRKSSDVADRLQKAVEGALVTKRLSGRRASMDVVGHDGLIRDIRAGRIPSVDRIEALFDYLDLEFYFGPKRQPSKPVPLRVVSNLDPEYDAPTGFIVIPWHAARPGDGSAPVAFSRAWLAKNSLIPDFLQAVIPDIIAGPGPRSADTVALIDTRIGDRKGADLWCFRDEGKTSVGRITFSGNLAAIHPVERDGEVRILEAPSAFALGLIGRVVWLGQIVPLKGKVG